MDKVIVLVIASSVSEAIQALSQIPSNAVQEVGAEPAGRTKVTIFYGEELVYTGINKQKAYTEAGKFAISHKLPGFIGEKWKNFALQGIVKTDWPNTGKKKLAKAGFIISEGVVAK